MMAVIQKLASSRLVMIPTEKDFEGDAAEYLRKYLRISETEAKSVIAINRLAWELGASSFAGRQAQYERLFFGGPQAVNPRLCEQYSGRKKSLHAIRRFLKWR